MPQPFSSRDDIKRDVFQEYLKVLLEWISVHRQTFFSAVGTVAVALAVVLFIFTNFRNLRKQAWEKYSAGQNWVYANNPGNAISSFDDVINNFNRTPAATYSLLGKADLFYQQRKFQEAADVYKKCLEKDPPKIILPFVLSGLGTAKEDAGDYAAAIEAYKQFVAEFPDHILAPKIYESLGRVYELSRNVEAAKEVYEKIITMFPATFWAEKARARYQALAPQPFQLDASPAKPAGNQ